MSHYEEEQARLLKLWEEAESEDAVIGSEVSNESDHESRDSHDSTSEEEADEGNSPEEEREDSMGVPQEVRVSRFYVGKDGTRWAKNHFPRNVRTRSENIFTHLPGVKAVAKHAKTPVECFNLLFNSEMIVDIVRWTNIKLEQKSQSYDRAHKYVAQETNVAEIKALFGLLYLAGFFRSARLNLEDLWSTDGTGIDIFRKTMSLQRFILLLSCLRFDNINNREERKQTDKLAPIRAIFERFVQNCQQIYTPNEYLTIDEKLEAFRGRCAFRQYMPNKPARYGIKIFALVDAKTYFVLNLEVYVGRQPDGPYQVSNTPNDVVLRLIAPISGTGRNVTFDNWFTSYELMKTLLRDHRTTSVGTVRKNKRQIPPSFLVAKGHPDFSSRFGFQEDITLVSYIPKKGKIVLLMSTLHHAPEIDEATKEQQKPEIITFYNATKSGVDVVDELSATYDVSRNSKRWPLTIFYALLNCAGINARIIYQQNTMDYKTPRRFFLKKLALELIADYTQVRALNPRLPRALQASRDVERQENEEPPGKRQKYSRRCCICPRNLDRKSFYKCVKCRRFVCLQHTLIYCDVCGNDTPNEI